MATLRSYRGIFMPSQRSDHLREVSEASHVAEVFKNSNFVDIIHMEGTCFCMTTTALQYPSWSVHFYCTDVQSFHKSMQQHHHISLPVAGVRRLHRAGLGCAAAQHWHHLRITDATVLYMYNQDSIYILPYCGYSTTTVGYLNYTVLLLPMLCCY